MGPSAEAAWWLRQLNYDSTENSQGKIPVPDAFKFGEPLGGDFPDRAMLSDPAASLAPARWDIDGYDRVGPGALDGKGAVLRRAILILLLGLGAPILILLVQAAMVALHGMRI